MKRTITSVFLALALTACAAQIPPEAIANANYGPKPPKNYQALVKADFATTLIDPTSPLYTFAPPRKGYTKKDAAGNQRLAAGWLVCGTVNSKNRFGGYTGSVPFFVLFNSSRIIDEEIGEGGEQEYNVTDVEINNICSR